MTTPTLIGLGGLLRSGKDAVADHLTAAHGFVKIGMSDALHIALLTLDPMIDTTGKRYSTLIAEVGYVEAKTLPEVRSLLQRLGTEVGREMIGQNVWSDITAARVDKLLAAGQPVVVTGIRYPNELQMIRALGGRTMWVARPGVEAPAGMAGHTSENSVAATDFEGVIDNSGTLDDLYRTVDALLTRDRVLTA